jgi:hypothetical protein
MSDTARCPNRTRTHARVAPAPSGQLALMTSAGLVAGLLAFWMLLVAL